MGALKAAQFMVAVPWHASDYLPGVSVSGSPRASLRRLAGFLSGLSVEAWWKQQVPENPPLCRWDSVVDGNHASAAACRRGGMNTLYALPILFVAGCVRRSHESPRVSAAGGAALARMSSNARERTAP